MCSGNVIVYPPGIWYGRVLPCHVPHLLVRLARLPNTAAPPRVFGWILLQRVADLSLFVFLLLLHQIAHCPGFAYVDTSTGERHVVRDETTSEAELKKLKPLMRGRVDPI
jgi:hypothetical protein